MKASVVLGVIGLFFIIVSTDAQATGQWSKRAPFPEPSEELVGASAGGKLYVFGGLGPGGG